VVASLSQTIGVVLEDDESPAGMTLVERPDQPRGRRQDRPPRRIVSSVPGLPG